MKVRVEACERVLRAMPRRDPTIRFTAVACIFFAPILSGIGLVSFGDTVSVLMLVSVSLGALTTDVLMGRLQSSRRDEESTQMVLERVLLAHLNEVLRCGLSILNAKNVALTVWDRSTGQLLDWNLQRPEEFSALEVAQAEVGVRPRRRDIQAAIYVRKGALIECAGVSPEGRKVHEEKLLEYLQASGYRSFQTLMLSYFEAGRRWQGTVAYIDAPAPSCLGAEILKLQQVVDIATSAVNSFLTACDSVRMDERRRLARDLHDGVIQTLIATELQVALIDRESKAATKTDDGVLDKVQEALCDETRKLRKQMEQLQSAESPESIEGVFEALTKEFERETGIATSLVCEMGGGPVPARLAYDLRYLLQEALSNVRRHSGATQVRVRLEVSGQVHFRVEDDGRGFGFCGRYDLAELRWIGSGPRTIRERVESNGGDLILESSPGTGVRIEISLPIPSAGEGRGSSPYILPGSPRTGPQRVPAKKLPQAQAGGSLRAMRRVK